MGRLRHARAGGTGSSGGRASGPLRWWAGAAGSLLLTVAVLLAMLPAQVLGSLLAAVTGAAAAQTAPGSVTEPHLEPAASVRWESSRPWTGNPTWGGPDGAGQDSDGTPGGTARSGTGRAAKATTARFGPTGPQPPTRPTDPVPPGPLEPPNRPWWIGGPTPPPCPWPREGTAPAGWRCQMSPMTDCPQYTGPDVHVVLYATPGTGSATISWWSYGDPDVRSYRVAAIRYTDRGSPNPTWEEFSLPIGCYQASHTITGLTPGERYEFMLEAVEVNHAGRNPALHRGIGRSDLVTIG